MTCAPRSTGPRKKTYEPARRLNGKIAMDKVAVMGTSCGGFLSIALGADPRVKTIGVFNSGVQTPPAGQAQGKAGRGGASTQPTADALPKLHGPVLLLNGGDPDFLMGASAATFEAINHVPAFYGARHNAGHSATVLSSRRRRVRQRRVELAPVDVQRRQESRQDVRRQGLRSLHEFELGREVERDQGMKSPIALAVVAGLHGRCCLGAECVVVVSFVFVSSRQQHAELAESRDQGRACEVQESA